MARPPKFDDDVILDRAMRTFWTRGWAATSIRDLEDALGLTAPAIYRRFGNKDGVARAVIDHYVARVVASRIDRFLPGSGDPLANLQAFFESAVTARPDTPLVGCLLTTITVEAPHLDPDLRDAVGRGFTAIDSAFRAELERAAATGALDRGVTVEQAAAMLTLSWHGLMVMARAGRSPVELRRLARGAVASVAARRTI